MLEKLKKLLEPDVSANAKILGVSLFIGRVIESLIPRIESLEARQLERGEKGDKGERGEKGDTGPAGIGLVGPAGDVGPIGPRGERGATGKSGKDGVSVVDSEIAADGHLVLKLSSGAIIDAGELPVADSAHSVFVSGNANQITVSATAPSDPQVGQLWYDIS